MNTYQPVTKVCTVCQQPYARQWGRCDRTTCSNKCRQQAHRNRVFAADEAIRQAARDKAEKARKRRTKKITSGSRPKKSRYTTVTP